MLRAHDLTKRFGGFTATDHVGLTIPRGSITACVGPNGAGKSTLVGLLSGALRADAGRITLDDDDVTALPAWARAGKGLRRTFQTTTGIGEMTVRENLELGAWRMGPDDTSADGRGAARPSGPFEVAKLLALEPHLDDVLSRLPLGIQRKVGIGVALIGRPSYLLLDEPLAGTGANDRSMLLAMFRDLAALDLGILWIEHDLASVRSTADALVVIDKGQAIAHGAVEAVVADPKVQAAYWGSTEAAGRHAGH